MAVLFSGSINETLKRSSLNSSYSRSSGGSKEEARSSFSSTELVTKLATAVLRIPICYPKGFWPLASDHLPIGASFNLGANHSLCVISWNVNLCPQRPKIPLTPSYQGLDDSSATLSPDWRGRILASQISMLLHNKRQPPDVLMLQGIHTDLLGKLTDRLKKSGYALCSSLEQCIVYREESFTAPPTFSTLPTPVMRNNRFVQDMFIEHKHSGKKVHLINTYTSEIQRPLVKLPTERPETLNQNAPKPRRSTTADNSEGDEFLIIAGDKETLIGIRGVEVIQPEYPTYIDPFNLDGTEPQWRGREAEARDLLFVKVPTGRSITALPASKMPDCIVEAIEVLEAAASQFHEGNDSDLTKKQYERFCLDIRPGEERDSASRLRRIRLGERRAIDFSVFPPLSNHFSLKEENEGIITRTFRTIFPKEPEDPLSLERKRQNQWFQTF